MTCIIGMEHEGRVYIGGDSVTNNDWNKATLASKKVFKVGSLLIGFAGHTRMMNLIQCEFNPREIRQGALMSDLEYVVRVVDVLRLLAKEHGFLYSDQGRDQLRGCSMLIGFHGGLHWVGYEFDVTRFASGIGAVGVGAEFALGALKAQLMLTKRDDGRKNLHFKPEEMLERALRVSGEFSAAVAAPYYVESI